MTSRRSQGATSATSTFRRQLRGNSGRFCSTSRHTLILVGETADGPERLARGRFDFCRVFARKLCSLCLDGGKTARSFLWDGVDISREMSSWGGGKFSRENLA